MALGGLMFSSYAETGFHSERSPEGLGVFGLGGGWL